MLMPKKTKHRKSHRGRRRGLSKGGNEVTFGDYGLQAIETSYITGRQIEAARITITRTMKRGGRVWINIFPHICKEEYMSINDLRELSIMELENKILDLKKELMDSRFALATSQIEDTSVFKKIKKEIAQANTILNQKINDMNAEENNE